VSRFDEDTAVRQIGPGRFRLHVSRDWWVVLGPNGGFVAAVLLRACAAVVGDPQRTPRTLTVHYLVPPVEGPAEVEVVVERAGRGVTYLSARLFQEGRLLALAVSAFAGPRPAVTEFSHGTMPDVPPPHKCLRLVADDSGIPLRHRWENLWAVGPLPGSAEPDPGEIEIGGWIRLAEPSPLDHVVLAAMADAWLPPIVSLPDPPTSAVPTVELTVHFRDRERLGSMSPEDWCLVVFRSKTAQEGFIEEDGEIWSADGRLLAQCRQLAVLLPLPPDHQRSSLRFETYRPINEA
jgi:acyl-CoA thioesterase